MNLIIGFLPPMLTLALTLARHLWYKLRLLRQLAQDGSILTHPRLSGDVNLPLRQGMCKVPIRPARASFNRLHRLSGESRDPGMLRQLHRFPVRNPGFRPPPERRHVILRTLHMPCPGGTRD